MIQVLTRPEVTPEELLEMPDAGGVELINGQLVEKPVSTLSCLVETLVLGKILMHSESLRLGPVWTGTMGFQCFPEFPKKVRKPDVSFVKAERFNVKLLATGYLPIAPDLAVEVISPGDFAHEVQEKIEEYRSVNVSLIWIIEPVLHIVDVYRKNGTTARLRENDELSGEDVLPGFKCRVGDLFAPIPTM